MSRSGPETSGVVIGALCPTLASLLVRTSSARERRPGRERRSGYSPGMGRLPTSWGGAQCVLSVGVAAVALLSCGDDSSATESFCDEGRPAYDALGEWLSDLNRPELDQVVTSMAEVDPPEAISDDWDSVVEALEGMGETDPGDPAAVAESKEGLMRVTEELRRVGDYIDGSC